MFAGLTSVAIVLAVHLLHAAEVSNELAEIFDSAEMKCLQKHRISQEERMSLLSTLDSSDENIKCFLSCFFEEVGMMKGTELNATLFNELLVEELRTNPKLDEEVTDMRKCIESVSGDDKCQKAFEYYRCLGHKFHSY